MSDEMLLERIEFLEEEVKDAHSAIARLTSRVAELKSGGEQEPQLNIRLYCRQGAYTSAPSRGSKIGKFGRMGQSASTLALNGGTYPVLDTYTLETEDLGTVRWVKVRCGQTDPTSTNDGFAYVPVKASLVNAEDFYNELMDMDDAIQLDDVTKANWGEYGVNRFMSARRSRQMARPTDSPPIRGGRYA